MAEMSSSSSATNGKAPRRRGRKGKPETNNDRRGGGNGGNGGNGGGYSNSNSNSSYQNGGRGGSSYQNATTSSPSSSATTTLTLTSSVFKPHQTQLIHLTEETPTWHQCGRNTQHRNDTIFSIQQKDKATNNSNNNTSHSNNNTFKKRTPTNPHHIVSKYRTLADAIYNQEVILHRQQQSNDKDEQWVENTMKRGTLKDRIAAMSVVVSSHPVHKLYALDMLLNLAGVTTSVPGENGHGNGFGHGNGHGHGHGTAGQTNDRVSQMASEALTDLFSSTLLPSNRKLIGLDARPLYLYEETTTTSTSTTKLTISPRILLLWRYEEILKNKYTSFLTQYIGRTLSQQSGTSSLDLTKTSCLRTACSLLSNIPEGEQIILSLVVNKIGDPSKKVAASSAHELRRILEVHPNMMTIIAREVQQMAHRPNLSTRALYNCIIFLNQLKLVKEEEESPKKEDNDNNNEEDDDDDNNNNNNNHKKNVSSANRPSLPASLINTYFQIFEVAVNKGKISPNDRAKQQQSKKKGSKKTNAAKMDLAMKGRLLGALLTGVNRAHPYLPTKDTGMEQHVDSLYKIAHISPPAACTQALMLLFHLAVGSSDNTTTTSSSSSNGQMKKDEAKVITSRKDRFYRVLYSKLADPNMFAGRQLTLFFNLLYKAMKYDTNSIRTISFAKRLLHIAFHQSPSVVSGALFLVSEVMKNKPLLQSSIFTTEGNDSIFDPTKREPSAAFTVMKQKESVDNEEKEEEGEGEGEQVVKTNSSSSVEAASLWEISLTMNHYHPTVSKFSSSMNEINYRGDPLRDFALAPFLDKFAFKNPKSSEKIRDKLRRGESIGERRSGLQGNVHALSSLPVNDPDFWKKGKSVSEQEEFFHKFFVERAKRDEVKGIVRGIKQDKTDILEETEDKEIRAMEDSLGKVGDDIDWETDDEEEAFVEKLAESLMENNSGGKVNFDEEDPDMDGWSDYDDEEDEGDASADDKLIPVVSEGLDDDDDDDDDDDGSSDEDELALSLAPTDFSSDEDQDASNSKGSEETKPQSFKSSFASADDYEERIELSLLKEQAEAKGKRNNTERDSDEEDENVNQSKRKRRRRSRTRKQN